MTQPITDPTILRALEALRLPDSLMYAALNPDLRIERASTQFRHFCDYDDRQIEGALLSEALPEVAGIEDAFQGVLRGEAPSFEIRRIMREGPQRSHTYASLLVVPRDQSDPGAGLLVIVQDTTDAGLLEQTLSHQRHDIALMQGELMNTADVLRQRNEELDSFNYTVAHDLKAPLMVISGYANVIRTELDGNLSDRAIRALKQIESTAYLMSNIIHNLLLFARLRDTTEVVATVEMKPVIERSLARVSWRVKDRGASIDVTPELPPVLGYGPWIEEALANLLENAIKYIGANNPDPRIKILARVENGWVSYGVQDNGIGITPENQAKLFEAFSRFDTDQAEGFGLGLAIVGRIVAKLNGTISVDSAIGKGATFWLQLPAPPNRGAAQPPDVPRLK